MCIINQNKWIFEIKIFQIILTNITPIGAMNVARGLGRRESCVECSLIHKMKGIERLTSTRTIASRRSYAKRRFWNFKKRLIRMPRIKRNCDAWPNEPKSKVMFRMNCRKCPRWFKTCRKALTKNWQHFLKTKHGFWLMNFFRFHLRLT